MFGKAKIWFGACFVAGAAWAAEPLWVAVDTETTGLSARSDRVVELGAVKFRADGTILCATNWLIHPGCTIPPRATAVHGITSEMVRQSPGFATVWLEFLSFCGDAVLLIHNAPFDLAFWRAELKRAQLNLPSVRAIDTVPLFRRWFPDAPGHSLDVLTARRSIGPKAIVGRWFKFF